jgi:selenide,water dikinase
LVGFDTVGDAGVYSLNKTWALVQTVDVITPIADDPFVFGEIAAANSLGDIYAMGARPLTALNILAFPPKLDIKIAEAILKGGIKKIKEARAVIVGGHTIRDEEIKYGLAVTGIVEKTKLIDNSSARPGDRLVLTKPLGTGIIATALKAHTASPKAIAAINRSMRTLNLKASVVMQQVGVHAATDVTGFGLLGHALNMAGASKVILRIEAAKVPLVKEVYGYAKQQLISGGTKANISFVQPFVEYSPTVDEILRIILCDAQTSGGLLIAVPKNRTSVLLKRLPATREIGEVIGRGKGRIEVI